MDSTTKGFVNYAETFTAADPDKNTQHSENHQKLLTFVRERISSSEKEMCKFYPRWRAAELRLLAFAESQLAKGKHKSMCKGEIDPHQEIRRDVAVPYIFSTMQTICTYMIQTFAGRKPMLQLGAYDPENLKKARLMEKKIQYDGDHTKIINKFWSWFWNSQLYGTGILHVEWDIKRALRREISSKPDGTATRKASVQTTFEGNSTTVVDPFLFFPDPSVPMSEVATEGEFVSWRSFKRKNYITKQGLLGNLAHTSKIKTEWANHDQVDGMSFRNRVSGYDTANNRIKGLIQVDTGTYEIIPEEYGFEPKGDTDFDPKMPAKWLIIMLNKDVIAYAAPYNHDHERHPVCVIEPYGDGHSFGSVGAPDLLGDIQETATFLLDSHIKSLRQVINQKILFDPSAINAADLQANQEGGALVRLKTASQGRDVNTILKDFTPKDPTAQNISSLATIMQIGDMISGTNDNLRGQQKGGSRKTATEVRSSNESSSNRMAAQSMRISSQGISEFKEISALNNMQFLSDDFSITLHGEDAVNDAAGSVEDLLGAGQPDTSEEITAQSIIGDFYFPIHDGTLPMDKVAIAQLWTQLFQVVLQDPELRMGYDLFKLFDRIAYLGGAENIEEFRNDTGRGATQGIPSIPGGGVPGQGVPAPQGAGGGVPSGPAPTISPG